MEPQIRYCTTSDGVSIAYYAMGDGPPMVIASNVLYSNVNFPLASAAEFHRSGRGFGRSQRIVRYDARGTGMSDRSALDFSIEARVRDLETVADHLGLESFDAFGTAHGSATAIAYAVAHPTRVRNLILLDGYASGAMFANRPSSRAFSSFRDMAGESWEEYTLAIANQNLNFSDSERAREMAERIRASVTPQAVLAFYDAVRSIDVTALLPRVASPTLVVCAKGRIASDPEWSRELASRIPHARFVMTESKELLRVDDTVVSIVEEFVGIDPEPGQSPPSAVPEPRAPGGTAIILFADIVDSTALTERLGDLEFRERASKLDIALREAIRACGGTPVEGRLVGDGLMAVFMSASQAIDAALRCSADAAPSGLQLHLGIHAGDVIRESDNVYGGAVNIASRIAGASAPCEVLVSRTVRDLARTSAGVRFEDRGEHALKGIAEPQHLFAVHAPEGSLMTEPQIRESPCA